MSSRNTQVSRILTILDLLDGNSNGLTVTNIHTRLLARGFDSGRRTIYRDLEALAQAGFPLFPNNETDENLISWKLERNTKINQYLVLSARELFALFLARGALTPLKSTPFFEDLESIFTKLEDKLGSKQKEYFNDLSNEVHFEPGPQWGLGLNPEVLETIRAACAEGHLVDCIYYSVNSKKESSRRLGPHYLYYARGGLYLVAEDIEAKKVKVFALPRMKQASMLEEAYNGKVHTPEEIFDGAFSVYTGTDQKEVIVDFNEDVAQYVRERRWHQSQRLVILDQGKVRVTLSVAETPELCAWILGFGPNAKVISPDTLAEKVAVLAVNTAKVYKKKVS